MVWVRSSLCVAAVILACGISSGVRAATVDLTFTGVNPGMPENVSTNSGANFNGENTGQFNFTVSNKDPIVNSVIPGSTVTTWCIELAQNTGPANDPYTVFGPALGSSFVSPLTNASALTAFFNQFYSPTFNTTQATAFQLDIWELEFDTSPGSLSSGNFVVQGNDAAVMLGNSWLSSFNPATTGALSLVQLHNDNDQDQIFAVGGSGAGQPTPLPSSLLGGGMLLVGLGLCAKIRRAPVV
jgi:hypothetical protein